jgi:ferrous iron transport protein A
MSAAAQGDVADEKVVALSGLSPGEAAEVALLTTTGGMRRRMQDIGLIEGTRVTCVLRGPLGDPSAFCVRGVVVALRATDAAGVLVRRLG